MEIFFSVITMGLYKILLSPFCFRHFATALSPALCAHARRAQQRTVLHEKYIRFVILSNPAQSCEDDDYVWRRRCRA
jgi:hypothetical protein